MPQHFANMAAIFLRQFLKACCVNQWFLTEQRVEFSHAVRPGFYRGVFITLIGANES
jgi:hypothetical protein